MAGTFAHTEKEQIFVPDTEFSTLPTGYAITALRGYAYTAAVLKDNVCVGWILIENVPNYFDLIYYNENNS